MSTGTPIPPLPTDAAGAFAQDVPPVASYTAAKDLQDTLDWSIGEAEKIGGYLGTLWDHSHILESLVNGAINGWVWYCRKLLEWELKFDPALFALEAKVAEKIFPLARDEGGKLIESLLIFFRNILSERPGVVSTFGSGELGAATVGFFNTIANQFNLLQSPNNPGQPGSGLKNQQYLVGQVAGLATTEWVIDWASQHLGLGVLKDLQPVRGMIDEVVNVRNVIRHANNAAYSSLLTAPLTRDLNRAYPVKNLGLSALARLYARGVITQQEYFDKCLNAGLDQTWAQHLIVESTKRLSSANIRDLVKHGLMTEADAIETLKQDGYQEGSAKALLYVETRARLLSIMERVGNASVTAWRNRYITQDRMEEILRQCGFSDEEINLLEIEGEFTKATQPKQLTYSQVKDLFTANIIGIDDVIAFLDAQGYAPQDRNNLVLLDFTELAERQTRLAVLLARDRVAAEAQRVQAAADDAKEKTALADARRALAAALSDQARTLGQLEALPGVASLLG